MHFPVIVEGSGKISFGKNAMIGRKTVLAVAKSSFINFQNAAILSDSVTIKIGSRCSLSAGNGVAIENGTRIYVNNDWKWGDAVKVATNCQLFSRENGYFGKLNIGNGSHIGDNTIIDVSTDVIIGNKVAIGPNCTIYSHDHVFDPELEAAWNGEISTKPVIIEDGAWIASGVSIMPGVKIGKKAIVAAGAVVTKDVGENTLVGGVPARLIRELQ